MSGSENPEQRFAKELQALVDKEERGTLAALRRGLGKPPGVVAEMHPFVLRWVAPGATSWQEESWYLVASLFAIHQKPWWPAEGKPGNNLGASFARLARAVDSKSIERRFIAMLNCDADDLPQHLRHAVSLLGSHDVPVDFAQLLRDLRGWNADSRWVQRNWARSFWAGGQRAETAGHQPAATPVE